MNSSNKNIYYLALGAFVLLLFAYANHFNNGFHFDDSHAIVTNTYIRDLKNIPAFFSDPKMFSSEPTHWGLRSLVTTTLAIDYWLAGGLYPFYFQLDTFIWHIALCILLYFVYKVLMRKSFPEQWVPYFALAAAAWYALHVVNGETLNYIISRSDVLSTFMIVLSFLIYINWPAKRKYFLYVIPAFLGVFAKETVLCLVITLFFYILLFEKDLSFGDLFRPKNFKTILLVIWQMLPLIIVVGVTQVYALTRIKSVPGISNPLIPYVLTQSYVWVHYFLSFFLPFNLTADSDWGVIHNSFDERIIIGCIFVVALAITIIRTSIKAKTKPIAFGLIWFSVALLPTSLAPFAEVTNDHRMYFPFIGLMLSVVTYAGLLIKRYSPVFENNKKYFSYLFILLFCILGLNAYGIYNRNKVWHDEESLWHDVSVKSPLNGRGLMNYGLALMDKGKYQQAEGEFKEAEKFVPTYSYLYINEGVLYGAQHKNSEAEENFEKAISMASDDFTSYTFYARFLLDAGRITDAQAKAEKALQLNPGSEMALGLLLKIYNQLGYWDQLGKTAKQYLTIIPGDKFAQQCLQASQTHQKVVVESAGKVSNPVTAEDYLNQSLDYYNRGDYNKCIEACDQALKLKPGYADAWNNIGAAYIKLTQWDKAIEACKKALAINPSYTLANNNLKFAESQLKK